MIWILANRNLPKFFEDVLATDGDSIFIAHLLDGLNSPVWLNEDSAMVEVTHWMFLPELPEVK
jgi:hypothetical protein